MMENEEEPPTPTPTQTEDEKSHITDKEVSWNIMEPAKEEDVPSKIVSEAHPSSKKTSLNKKAMNVLQPFIYSEKKSMDWKDDVRLKMIAPTCLIKMYWETNDGVNLLQYLHETAEEMKSLTSSKGYILYVVDDEKNHLFLCSKSLQELEGRRYSWRLGQDQTIAAYVACEQDFVITVNDESIDGRFPAGQDLALFPCTNILAVPVASKKICVAVIELYRQDGVPYTEEDAQITMYLSSLAADVIVENREEVKKRKKDEVNDFFLENLELFCPYTDGKMDHDDDLYIKHIVNSANVILSSESVTYFSTSSYDNLKRSCTTHDNPVAKLSTEKKKIRHAKETEVAWIINRSHEMVNFVDVFNDPRFDKSVDRFIGLLIRSVLGCQLQKGGVIMAINKKTEEKFTLLDEGIFALVIKYLIIGLRFVSWLRKLANEKRIAEGLYQVFDFQLTRKFNAPEIFNIHETVYIPSEFYQFSFDLEDPRSDEIQKYMFHMVNNLASTIIPNKTHLYNFIFGAKKLHREMNPFHNFHNAFKSVHYHYLILKAYPQHFTTLEKYAMLLASMVHKCDHRGMSVKFLQLTNHPTVDKSEATPIETYRYDLSQCLFQRSHVLDHFNNDDKALFDKIFKECIRASNITLYLKRLETLKTLTSEIVDWKSEQHRTLMRTLIVIAGDFLRVAKSQEDCLIATRELYTEFFREADILRQIDLTIESIPDREQRFTIPSREETFCRDIALPCYEILKEILSVTTPLYDCAINVLGMWSRMANEIQLAEEDTSKISEETLNYLNSIP